MWGLPKGRKQLAANIDAASAEVDTNAGEENEEIKPIGKGVFGNIYDQFKGKVKAAFDFLINTRAVICLACSTVKALVILIWFGAMIKKAFNTSLMTIFL